MDAENPSITNANDAVTNEVAADDVEVTDVLSASTASATTTGAAASGVRLERSMDTMSKEMYDTAFAVKLIQAFSTFRIRNKETDDDDDNDDQLAIDKEDIVELFKIVLGTMYTDDIALSLIGCMAPDENGKVSLKNFFHAFSLHTWPQESLAAMQEVLTSSPKMINKLTDWKDVFNTLGFEMAETEVENVVQKACESVATALKLELENSEEESSELVIDPEEVQKRSTHILELLREKMMDICSEQKVATSSDENPEME